MLPVLLMQHQQQHQQRPWASDTLTAAADASTHPLLRARMAKLSALLYDPAFEAQEAAAAAAKGHAELAARFRRDRVIIAESLKAEHQKATAAEAGLMQKELAEAKAFVMQELQALKPLALKRLVGQYQQALASAGGGRSHLIFGGGAQDEDEDEDGESEKGDAEEEAMRVTAPYDGGLSLSPPAVGSKRSGTLALVTPGASSSSCGISKKKAKRARAEKREELQELLTVAMVGEEGAGGGHSGGVEELSALLGMEGEGGGADEAALVGEALKAINVDMLAGKMKQAMAQAQRESEREMAQRWNEEVAKRVRAAVACAREELEIEFSAKLEEEVEKARVLLEVDFDVRKKELEEQMAAAAGAAASEATVKAPVGPSAGKGKLAVTGKTKGKGSSKA